VVIVRKFLLSNYVRFVVTQASIHSHNAITMGTSPLPYLSQHIFFILLKVMRIFNDNTNEQV